MAWQRYQNKFQRRSKGNSGSQSNVISASEWDEVFTEAIDDLDQTCAKVRHVIYELRKLTRSQSERGE